MAREYDLDIKGFLETSFLDWPGKISSVLFLAGCNFRCPFCHNYGLVLNPGGFPSIDWNDVKGRLKKFTGWIDGVVISGGEPTLSNGLAGLVREIKEMGFLVKLDTNGSRPTVLKALLDDGLIDQVAMDIKGPLDDFSYARSAGRSGFVERVKESLDLLRRSSIPYLLRTTVVPNLHTEQDVMLLAEQLMNDPEWILQNFNPENALDCSYRKIETWDDDEFQLLTARALSIHKQSA